MPRNNKTARKKPLPKDRSKDWTAIANACIGARERARRSWALIAAFSKYDPTPAMSTHFWIPKKELKAALDEIAECGNVLTQALKGRV